MKKKPDLMLVVFLALGIGVAVSSIAQVIT